VNDNNIGNHWGKGFYTDGAEVVDQVMDAVRREVEDCDCFQGFQMVHSIGDGCGGGAGSLLLEKIRDEIGNDPIATFSLVPRYGCFSADVTWPYNAGLTLSHMNELVDMTFFVHTTVRMNHPLERNMFSIADWPP
jgi:tubulin beta